MISPGETCDGINWGPITGCSDFDEFTGGTLTCGATNCKFDTSGETCDGNDWGPITECSDFDQFTGGTLTCGADCNFDTSQCIGGDPINDEIGTCIYTQYSDDNCDDGFLTFLWTALWQWDENCDLTCQEANQDLTLGCVDGQKTVECPAQIPLPFFNAYSFIATLIIIAFIYTIMITLKKKKIRIK